MLLALSSQHISTAERNKPPDIGAIVHALDPLQHPRAQAAAIAALQCLLSGACGNAERWQFLESMTSHGADSSIALLLEPSNDVDSLLRVLSLMPHLIQCDALPNTNQLWLGLLRLLSPACRMEVRLAAAEALSTARSCDHHWSSSLVGKDLQTVVLGLERSLVPYSFAGGQHNAAISSALTCSSLGSSTFVRSQR